MILVGPTGAGKTSLLRHLIGTDPEKERFPSTSAARTTISDTEVICAVTEDYEAVVTLVAVDSGGRPSFQALQRRSARTDHQIVYSAFDLRTSYPPRKMSTETDQAHTEMSQR